MHYLNKVLGVVAVIGMLSLGVPQGANAGSACVMAPNGLCTRDINPCGNAGICKCPAGYVYDQAVGLCIIDDMSKASEPGASIESKCAVNPNGICTMDINRCGNPSICQCPDGHIYNPVVGKCIVDLGA
jgi:hypothetical protein